MDKLPNEILEIILASPRLTSEDILNFGTTCKHFYELVHHSSFIWKKKYQHRFPKFMKFFDNCFNDWYTELLYQHSLYRRSHELLATMSPRFYKHNELSESDFAEWLDLISESPRAYHYIILDLLNILNDCTPIKSIKVVPVDTPGNKTFQYYASKVLRFIRQKHLTQMWQEFEKLPAKEQLLEKGATFIAQWCQPASTFEWEDIAVQLDNIAKEVMIEVQSEYPNHPLLKVPEEVLLQWKLHNIDGNQFNISECQQIMKCIIIVMYIRHGFSGNNIAYYMPENSYINEVLSRKQGLPISLAVVFESIARRVGLKCEPYAFPSHFLLKFNEGRGDGQSYYIDVFNHGNIIRKGSCPRNSQGLTENPHRYLETATTQQVVDGMVSDIEVAYQQTYQIGNTTTLRSILELERVINPEDLNVFISLARLYVMYDIDTAPLEYFFLLHKYESEIPAAAKTMRQLMYDQARKRNIAVTRHCCKERTSNIDFAVGMVMKHCKYNYLCVIYDWDPICKASVEWQQEMGVHKLENGDNQPFYNVLVEDGSQRYAAQENLTPTKSTVFLDLNEDIGKHFSHFFETHYVPNAEKEQEFPLDAVIRESFHKDLENEDENIVVS